jgi:hypothetical protein
MLKIPNILIMIIGAKNNAGNNCRTTQVNSFCRISVSRDAYHCHMETGPKNESKLLAIVCSACSFGIYLLFIYIFALVTSHVNYNPCIASFFWKILLWVVLPLWILF